MNTNITIRLGNAQMDVAQKLGTDQGKAVNELVAVSIEAAHDDLATKEFVRTELHELRKDFNTTVRWIMGVMITGFVTMIAANVAAIMALVK